MKCYQALYYDPATNVLLLYNGAMPFRRKYVHEFNYVYVGRL